MRFFLQKCSFFVFSNDIEKIRVFSPKSRNCTLQLSEKDWFFSFFGIKSMEKTGKILLKKRALPVKGALVWNCLQNERQNRWKKQRKNHE